MPLAVFFLCAVCICFDLLLCLVLVSPCGRCSSAQCCSSGSSGCLLGCAHFAGSAGQDGQVVRWSGGQVVRWSGCQVVRWSGGQVVRWSGGQGSQSVHDVIMARVVQVVQTVPVVPMVLWSKSGQSGWSRWSGSQLVRVVRVHDLDGMLSEIIWLSCPKSLLNN